MPSKKRKDESSVEQIVVRVSVEMHEDLKAAARGLGLDLSNFLRMMFTEQLPEYVARGKRAAAARVKAQADIQEPLAAPGQARFDLEQPQEQSGSYRKIRGPEHFKENQGSSTGPSKPADEFGKNDKQG